MPTRLYHNRRFAIGVNESAATLFRKGTEPKHALSGVEGTECEEVAFAANWY